VHTRKPRRREIESAIGPGQVLTNTIDIRLTRRFLAGGGNKQWFEEKYKI